VRAHLFGIVTESDVALLSDRTLHTEQESS